MIQKINSLRVGDIISESSHYKVLSIGTNVDLYHQESGETVTIGKGYLQRYTNSGDEYEEEVEVTKEDKRDGTPGIRTIFEGIHSGQVFTVCFKKQDKPKSKKQYDKEVAAIIDKFSADIDTVKNNKKGVANAAKSLVQHLLDHPVLPYIEGEERVLRGYKIQFESRDGRYNCIDMDIERTDKEEGIRPVNINTIKWLIYNGKKYVVK